MISRTAIPLLLAVAALVLGGCAATPADTTADDAAPTSTAPSDASPTDDAMDDAASSPGAYVDYREGVIAETTGAKVLFFHAPWCTQCRQLEQSLLSEGIPDGTTIIKVDFDSETELRQRYGVTLQTTVVHVDDEGEALGSTVLYDEPSIDALLASAP